MIFKNFAHKYYESGVPVIPLNGKDPFLPGWSRWSTQKQTEEDIDELVSKYPNCNIGAVLGYNLCALDIDIDDDITLKLVPDSCFKRRGRKGVAAIYKASDIKNIPGTPELPIEFLNVGRALALPPSIHPETKEPYVWLLRDLIGLDQNELTEITLEQIENIRAEYCERNGVTKNNKPRNSSGRNNALIKVAFALACSDKRPDAAVEELLEYDQKYHSPPWFTDPKEPHKGKDPRKAAVYMYERARSKLDSKLKIVEFKKITKPKTLAPNDIPDPIKDWVLAESKRLQVCAENIIFPYITQIGALLGRKLIIQPKTKDTWNESATLWGIIIDRASSMKSPALKAALKDGNDLSRSLNEAYEKSMKENGPSIQALNILISGLKSELKSKTKECANNDELEILSNEYSEKIRKIEKKISKITPTRRRFVVNDSTTEKIGEILRDNPGGIFLVRDELSGFFNSFQKKGRESDREFYLESFNGNSSYIVDRIERGTITIPCLKISIFGSTQPNKILPMISSIASGQAEDDGFLNRFQLISYPQESVRTYCDIAIDSETIKKREDLFLKIYHLAGSEIVLNFNEEAQAEFIRFYNKLESNLALLQKSGDALLEQHLGKFRSLIPKLALIFEVLDWASPTEDKEPLVDLGPTHVTLKNLNMAIRWSVILFSQFKSLIFLAENTIEHSAKTLLKKILEHEVYDRMNLREINRKGWKYLKDIETINGAINFLSQYNVAHVYVVKAEGSKRDSSFIKINPLVYQLYSPADTTDSIEIDLTSAVSGGDE
jgi:hypothetical protein